MFSCQVTLGSSFSQIFHAVDDQLKNNCQVYQRFYCTGICCFCMVRLVLYFFFFFFFWKKNTSVRYHSHHVISRVYATKVLCHC